MVTLVNDVHEEASLNTVFAEGVGVLTRFSPHPNSSSHHMQTSESCLPDAVTAFNLEQVHRDVSGIRRHCKQKVMFLKLLEKTVHHCCRLQPVIVMLVFKTETLSFPFQHTNGGLERPWKFCYYIVV